MTINQKLVIQKKLSNNTDDTIMEIIIRRNTPNLRAKGVTKGAIITAPDADKAVLNPIKKLEIPRNSNNIERRGILTDTPIVQTVMVIIAVIIPNQLVEETE